MRRFLGIDTPSGCILLSNIPLSLSFFTNNRRSRGNLIGRDNVTVGQRRAAAQLEYTHAARCSPATDERKAAARVLLP